MFVRLFVCVSVYISHTVMTTLHVNVQCLVLVEISQPTFSVGYSTVSVSLCLLTHSFTCKFPFFLVADLLYSASFVTWSLQIIVGYFVSNVSEFTVAFQFCR